ncbi:MAG: hypothetical protein HY005_02335 [Candidatus Staskawiczbacteria bacterium]|nr:hypothetical protein [Candidatus Staskawiczbacteria bacterium]
MDITKEEELQAKEFLKRAEIKTMRKDLQKMREVDALEERNKVIKGEEKIEKKEEEKAIRQLAEENKQREKVLSKNIENERSAEKQIKSYAEESEKQQIFLFESQRLGLEKQIDVFEQEKESSLLLEKNQILIEKRTQETKLNNIIEEEQKIEKEEKFIAEKEKTSNIPSEKKSLEERRGELETKRQEIEKKRWAVEKEIKKLEDGLEKIDADSLQITKEKDILREKVRAIDMSLREIYSKIISRVEDKKRGLLEEQMANTATKEQLYSEKKEKIQREQWTKQGGVPREKEFLKNASDETKKRLIESAKTEEEQRKKFLENIEKQTMEEQNKNKTTNNEPR